MTAAFLRSFRRVCPQVPPVRYGPAFRWLALAFAALHLAACAPKEPDVELGSPEEAAESVGRILCAEHEQRVEAIGDELDAALAIQAAKAEVLADTTGIGVANEKLEAFAEFYDDNEDELTSCEIVLTDLDTIDEGSRVNLALRIATRGWKTNESGELELVDESRPLVLTLTKLEGEWKVTGTSADFALPGGALNSLMD